ncbi:MAG TPA: ATP-binding protein [Candidatus Binatia bacterium]|nr:ATP-binding protein [Candidatus Binatia bacterium]
MDGDPSRSLAHARSRLITRRLPRFAAIWLPAALAWAAVLYIEGRVGALEASALPVGHAAILLATVAVCRRNPVAPRVLQLVMLACILLGVTTTVVFSTTGASGEFLAFTLLTLYLLAALAFVWGWQAELTLLGLTVIPWLVAVPGMTFAVPTVELVTAILVGSVLALAIAEGAGRAFAIAFRHRENEEANRRALEASHKEYRDLAEHAHEPIFAADFSGRFTYVNAAMARALGETDLIGRPVDEFLSAHPANERLRALLRGANGAERATPLEFETRTVGGLRWFETQPSIVRDDAGTVCGIRAICRDVTDRKRIERERDAVIVREHAARIEAEQARLDAEAASRARDQFLAMLSHELRSPLGSILTWTRMLRRGLVDDSRVPHALASMEDAALAQERLVGDLLDISRIAAGKFSLQLERVDVAALAAARVEAARTAAGTKGIALEERVDRRAGVVRADPTRLTQVIDNVVSNAIKFTPGGGRVTVTVERVGREVQVIVRDTGIGIPPAVVPHVFDEFQQADRSITRRYGGLGLGLAIARRLVEAHGGQIEAESAGEGQGATFRLRLPLAEGTGPAAAPRDDRPPAAAAPSALAGVKVLVVEDDPYARDVVTALLARHGAEVHPTASVREAVADVAATPPDVVVADIAMPDEDGYALVRRLRAMERERGGHLPVIAVTALASAEDRERALGEGFDEHLTKPIEPAELLRVVARRAAGNR